MLVFGLITVILITCFTWAFSYINEPLGDDVLAYYDGGMNRILDGLPEDIGERITSPLQIFKELKFIYMHWSGRMVGYAASLFGKLLPKLLQALITALLFSGNILLAMRIPYGSLKNAIRSPLVFGGLFLVIYWYRAGCFYEYMWTMVTIYALPIFLILLYYNLFTGKPDARNRKRAILAQCAGFAAGFSHEVLSLFLIIIIGVEWIRDMITKKARFKDLLKHTGLGIGYLLCFFAPGNFNRTTQSHDAVTNSYADRLKIVWDAQKNILTGMEEQRIVFYILAIAALAAAVILLARKEDFAGIVKERAGVITAACASVFVCAAVPKYPIYGQDLWICLVYILLLSFAVKLKGMIKCPGVLRAAAAVMLMAVFLVANAGELRSYESVSRARRRLAGQAVTAGESSVVVPRFDETLSPDRYFILYLNDQDVFDQEHYIRYYGTRLVVYK